MPAKKTDFQTVVFGGDSLSLASLAANDVTSQIIWDPDQSAHILSADIACTYEGGVTQEHPLLVGYSTFLTEAELEEALELGAAAGAPTFKDQLTESEVANRFRYIRVLGTVHFDPAAPNEPKAHFFRDVKVNLAISEDSGALLFWAYNFDTGAYSAGNQNLRFWHRLTARWRA